MKLSILYSTSVSQYQSLDSFSFVPQAKPFSYANPPDSVDAPWPITRLVSLGERFCLCLTRVVYRIHPSATNSTADQETSQDPKSLGGRFR